MKHLMQSTNPEAGTVCYGTVSGSTCQDNGYDANGNLAYKTNPAPNQTGSATVTTTYAYDFLNRMTGRAYSNGDPSVAYTYATSLGPGCPNSQPSFNIGRRIAMTDAGGSESFAYDRMGRECTEQRITNGISKTTSYAYNYDGSLATLTYPSGRTITNTPNIDGAPISAADLTNGITYASGAVYAPQGGLSSLTQGSNLVSTMFYNSRLQPCRIAATAGATSPTSCSDATNFGNILDLAYNFSSGTANNGDVYAIMNNRDNTRSQSFAYDNLNRIMTAQTAGTFSSAPAMCWGETFYYDNATTTNTGEFGNLTNVGVSSSPYNGCTQDALNVTATPNNQISATGMSYDSSGNVLTDGVNTYAWNAESEQKTGGSVNYVYDGDGNRLYKTTSSTPSKIYWYGAGTEILDESDASGNITNEYVFFGSKRAAMDTVSGSGGGSIGATYYYAEDFLGSSRAMVQAGATSACFDADFLPFGREKDAVATCTQNDYKFEGKERDAETGNDDFGARYYSSNFGRWLSPDWSSTPEAVPYANLTNPQTLNLYAMVQDNPESFADLDGHWNTPESASQYVTCDVTTGNGCLEGQLGEITGFNIRNALGEHITPDQMARMINEDSPAGDPYALIFTPASEIKVPICLKDVVACQEETEAIQERRDAAWLKVGADVLGLAAILSDGELGPEAEQVEAEVAAKRAAADAEEEAAAARAEAKVTSPNQMNQQAMRGQAPKSVDRVDSPRFPNEKPHVEFRDGNALNNDGTWKHGGRSLTNEEKEWLSSNGWKLPQ